MAREQDENKEVRGRGRGEAGKAEETTSKALLLRSLNSYTSVEVYSLRRILLLMSVHPFE